MTQTGDKILDKAVELFCKNGIRRVTLNQIATELGISKKTIYSSYKSKDDIVHHLLDKHLTYCQDKIQSFKKTSVNAIDELFMWLAMDEFLFSTIPDLMVSDMKTYYPAASQKMHDFKYNFVYKALKKNIVRGKKEGLYRPEVDADIAVRSKLAIKEMIFTTRLASSSRHPFNYVIRQSYLYFIYGIATTKAGRAINLCNQKASKYKQ